MFEFIFFFHFLDYSKIKNAILNFILKELLKYTNGLTSFKLRSAHK